MRSPTLPREKSSGSFNTAQWGARRSRQVSRSRAVAAEGHSTHDRGSGCIVGGELDVTSRANETEKSDAQR